MAKQSDNLGNFWYERIEEIIENEDKEKNYKKSEKKIQLPSKELFKKNVCIEDDYEINAGK